MSKRKTILIVLLAVLLLVSGVLPVFANQVNQKQKELDSVRGDLTQRKQELRQNKSEQDKIVKEIQYLEQDMNVIQVELRSLRNKIKGTESKISVAEADLATAENKVDMMDEVLAVRLRSIHENGNVSYLDVLFASSSFTEFLTRYNDMQMLIAEDHVLLAEFQIERERIEAVKAALEERRQELLTLRRQNLLKNQQLESKRAEQRQLASMLQEAIDETENEVKKLEAEAKALNKIIKDLQARQRRTSYRGSGTMQWPVPEFGTGWITSPYGYRNNPFTGRAGTFHGGVDIGIPHSRWPGSRAYSGQHAVIVAAEAGIAYTYRMGSGYGNLVIIDHGGGISTVYGHASDFLIPNGKTVQRGEAIATVGSTGYSTGPHLHFEVRVNGVRVDPMPYIR